MKNKYLAFLMVLFMGMGVASVSQAAFNGQNDMGQGVQKRDGTRMPEGAGKGPRNEARQGVGDPMSNRPFVRGEITAINGTTITMSAKSFGMDVQKDNTTTSEVKIYNIDVSGASFYKDGATSKISELAVGETIMVEGVVDGLNIKATKVHEGNMSNGNRANVLDKDDMGNRTKNNRSVWGRIGNFFSKIFKGNNK